MLQESDSIYLRDIGCSEKSEPNGAILLSSLWRIDEACVDAIKRGKYHYGAGISVLIWVFPAREIDGQKGWAILSFGHKPADSNLSRWV